MPLNPDQQAAFEAVKRGDNIFLTGPAGAGKTFLIRHIVEWAQSEKRKISVAALTGCAALLLGFRAKTLHSWAGIGLGREPIDKLIASILKVKAAKQRWKSTKILIIDEISMLTTELFEKLDAIGRAIRQNNLPWGGTRLPVPRAARAPADARAAAARRRAGRWLLRRARRGGAGARQR